MSATMTPAERCGARGSPVVERTPRAWCVRCREQFRSFVMMFDVELDDRVEDVLPAADRFLGDVRPVVVEPDDYVVERRFLSAWPERDRDAVHVDPGLGVAVGVKLNLRLIRLTDVRARVIVRGAGA